MLRRRFISKPVSVDVVMSSSADLVSQAGKKSFKEHVAFVFEVITVEPLLACYIMSSALCGPAIANLEYEKTCRVNLGLNDSVCSVILRGEHEELYSEVNNDIQVVIAKMHSWQQPVQSIVPLILILFLGSFSDRYQWRKPFLLWPLIGELFAVVGVILCVVFMESWPLEVQGFAQTIVPSFFGGSTMVVMAVFAYIADVSTLEMRTMRIGVVQIVLNICIPIVQSFSGILFEKGGYYVIFGIAGCLYTFAILYGYYWIKEPRKTQKVLLKDAFDPTLVVETFNLLFKRKPGTKRLAMALVLILLFMFNMVNIGEGSLSYFYVQKNFGWTPVEFSYFATVNTLVHLFGTLVGVPLFTKYFLWHDYTILIVTFLDKIIANVFLGVAQNVIILYVGICISLFTGVTNVAIRSLATKTVSENDLGKAQSLFGICEAVAAALAVPFYNVIYTSTLTTYSASFFFVSMVLYVPCCVIVFWMYLAEGRKKPTPPAPSVPSTHIETTHI